MLLRPTQTLALEKTSAAFTRVRRVLLNAHTAFGKCFAPGTQILLYDGSIKSVEDIAVGDLLMGPDSTPRRVIALTSGVEEMFTITPKRGMPYTVNKPHILSLKMTGGSMNGCGKEAGSVVNIPVFEYLKASAAFRHCAKGWKVAVDFPAWGEPIRLDPYFLGIWLGDGTSASSSVTTADAEVVEFMDRYSEHLGLTLRRATTTGSNKASTYHPTTGIKGRPNPIRSALRSYGALNNKHIPLVYKAGSRDTRLKVLAGIIDTDGCYTGGGYELTLKSERLLDDVLFVARSLGLSGYKRVCTKRCGNNGVKGTYWRCHINGDVHIVPCLIARKQAKPRKIGKDILLSGISVKSAGMGIYFGFELSGPDQLFLLGDFTVAHNSTLVGTMLSRTKKSVLYICPQEGLMERVISDLNSAGIRHGVIHGSRGALPNTYRVHVSMPKTIANRLDSLPNFDWIISDECLSADTLIDTDVGSVRITDIPLSGATMVLTVKDETLVWRGISAWMPKGVKPTIKLQLSNGRSIICTSDHLFFMGGKWTPAEQLKSGDPLVSHAAIAPVDVELHCSQTPEAGTEGGFLGINVSGPRSTGASDSPITSRGHHCAYVDAEGGLNPPPTARTNSSAYTKVAKTSQGSSWATNADHETRQPHSRSVLGSAYLALFWVMDRLGCPTARAPITAWRGRTGFRRRLGSNTRLTRYANCLLSSLWPKIGVLELPAFVCERRASPASPRSLASPFEMDGKPSLWIGSIKSAMKDWLGGIATTDISGNGQRSSTPKDTHSKRFTSFGLGWKKNSAALRFIGASEATTTSGFRSARRTSFFEESSNSSRTAWATNSITVKSIEPWRDCEVFDISVEDTHSFFANGALVHNCHLALSDTWSSVLEHYANAWQLGMSGSPCRLDGKPLGKHYDEIVYGPSIKESTARGYLVPIRVFAPPPPTQIEFGATRKMSLERAAEVLNTRAITGSAIDEMRKRAADRQAMVFTCNRKHSENVAQQFRDAGISAVSVDSTISDRKERFRDFENQRAQVLVNVELATTGYDYPPVSLGIMLRDTDSLALALQIWGRFVRISPGKTDALLHDHVGMVLSHGLPDADREWTLEGRPMRTAALAVRQCGKCYAVFSPAPRCPECGYVIPVSTKASGSLQQRDGELAEVTEATIAARRQADIKAALKAATTRADFIEVAARFGNKPGWGIKMFEIYGKYRRRAA